MQQGSYNNHYDLYCFFCFGLRRRFLFVESFGVVWFMRPIGPFEEQITEQYQQESSAEASLGLRRVAKVWMIVP